MSNYKEFYDFLINNNMITPIWSYILEIIDNEIREKENKDDYLMIFSIYFLNYKLIFPFAIKFCLQEKQAYKFMIFFYANQTFK